jgi:CheY-like chemotaxis protein
MFMSFITSRPLGAVPADVKGSVVLVVDDEQAWRKLLEAELLMLGYRPVIAEDGLQGVSYAIEHDPDVAIVDLALPGLDGWNLLSELRSRGVAIPTIFYSAYPMGRAEAQHPDVVACVSKRNPTASVHEVLPLAIRTRKRDKRRPGSAPPASPPVS